MFHSLFLNMFHVKMAEEDLGNQGGGGGGETTTETTQPVETSTETTTEVAEEGKPSTDVPSTEEPPVTEEVELFYGAESVNITIPDDLSAELESKGLNATELANELYRKDGGFKLSDETRGKLDAAYGKFAVDAFLGSLKTQNDAFLQSGKDEAAAREKADSDRFASLTEPFGGEEGWNALSSWGNENLSEEQINDLNQVMASGHEGVQRYALQMLANQKRAAEGDPEAVLIQGNAPETASGGALSADQYRTEMAEARKAHRQDPRGFAQAQEKLDARRRAGQAKGL